MITPADLDSGITMATISLALDHFSYGGETFGRLEDKRAVFVPFTLPGERVVIRLVEEKKGYARGELLEVLEPSPFRIEPRCPHFTLCGGCHYQHIPYKHQLQAKDEIIRDQLNRIGKLDEPPLQPVVPSPNPWNYRNHIQFHISPEGILGFQRPRSHKVIPIKECHLPEVSLGEIWPRLDMEFIPGLDRVGLRVGVGEDILVNLESSDPEPVEMSLDLPISVVHTGPGGSLVLAGDDKITMEIAGRVFQVSAGSFFQVNSQVAEAMVQHILDHLSIPPEATLVDAFCGVGLFSAFLAPRVDRLIGIESSPSACEDFVVNLDEFENVDLYEAPVGDVLPAIETPVDIIVLDPPRTGLDRTTMDAVLSLGPAILVYVSCDPATLSRDSHRLAEGGYKMTQLTPFDLFPQTYHIESISFFHKG
jgi:23S rRNA (uracil1939-C5)-methyltransferase